MKSGAKQIYDERKRQVLKEGWTADHDDRHRKGELAMAAACYAGRVGFVQTYKLSDTSLGAPPNWPWAKKWWKPKGHIRDLVRAGALIAAEIDRLQRIKPDERSPCENCGKPSVWEDENGCGYCKKCLKEAIKPEGPK